MVESNDNSLRGGVRDDLRLRVLRAVEADPSLSQRQLAAKLGVSLGGVNYALRALIEKGFVKAANFQKSSSKARYLYILTPKGAAEKASLAADFLVRKLEEHELLRQEIEALKVELDLDDKGLKDVLKHD